MVFLGWSFVWRMRNSSLFKHDEAFLEMKYLIKTHTSIGKSPLTFLKLMKKTFHRIKCLIIKVNNSVYVAMAPDWPYLTSWNVQCTYVSPFWPFVHKKTGFEGTKKPQVSKTASRVYCPEWRFWKTPAFCLRVDGRKIVTIMLICWYVDVWYLSSTKI